MHIKPFTIQTMFSYVYKFKLLSSQNYYEISRLITVLGCNSVFYQIQTHINATLSDPVHVAVPVERKVPVPVHVPVDRPCRLHYTILLVIIYNRLPRTNVLPTICEFRTIS